MSATTLKEQAMAATTRLASKFILSSRDLSAASNSVAYTGVGFQPTSIICFNNIEATIKEGRGFCDSARNQEAIYVDFDNNYYKRDSTMMFFVPSQNNYVGAVVASLDTDGFTVTWTKTGSPTGTASLLFMCFR